MKRIANDNQGNPRVQFTAKLESISENTFENVNGKLYKAVTVSFKDIKGNPASATGIIYEGNYKRGVEPGKEYLTVATQTEKGVLITMSHLTSAERPTADMFDFSEAEVEVKSTSKEIKLQE